MIEIYLSIYLGVMLFGFILPLSIVIWRDVLKGK